MNLSELFAQFAQEGVFSIILTSGPFAKAILGVLFCGSIITWAIIIERAISYHRAAHQTSSLLRLYSFHSDPEDFGATAQRFRKSPLSAIFLCGLKEWQGIKEHLSQNPGAQPQLLENLSSALERAESLETERLERSLVILATAGSVSPFLGLLGTVWGVMKSFLNISAKGSAHLQVVAPGIAEALITTVAGLLVAIPALIAYNYYVGRGRKFALQMERFTSQILDEFRLKLFR